MITPGAWWRYPADDLYPGRHGRWRIDPGLWGIPGLCLGRTSITDGDWPAWSGAQGTEGISGGLIWKRAEEGVWC